MKVSRVLCGFVYLVSTAIAFKVTLIKKALLMFEPVYLPDRRRRKFYDHCFKTMLWNRMCSCLMMSNGIGAVGRP